MIFYVTFGQQHPLRHGYVIIHATDYSQAREAAFDALGTKWAFIYNDTKDMSIYKLGAVGEPIIGE